MRSNYPNQIITVTLKNGEVFEGVGEVDGAGVKLLRPDIDFKHQYSFDEIKSFSVDDDPDNVMEAVIDIQHADMTKAIEALARMAERVFDSITDVTPLDRRDLTDLLVERLNNGDDNNEVMEGQA